MSVASEHTLNAALAGPHIGAEYEEWLAIVDRFYAEHVQVSSDVTPGRLIGRSRVKQALLKILAPLHRHDEHHSAWSLEIVGASGRRATVRWCVRRIWRRGLVVHEHFYENDMNGHGWHAYFGWPPHIRGDISITSRA